MDTFPFYAKIFVLLYVFHSVFNQGNQECLPAETDSLLKFSDETNLSLIKAYCKRQGEQSQHACWRDRLQGLEQFGWGIVWRFQYDGFNWLQENKLFILAGPDIWRPSPQLLQELTLTSSLPLNGWMPSPELRTIIESKLATTAEETIANVLA